MIQKLKILWYQRHDLWHWYRIYRKHYYLCNYHDIKSSIKMAMEATVANTSGYCCYYEETLNAKRI